MAGSIIFSVGSFGNIFVQNLGHLIITYGVIQGFGFGLILPSVLSAMNVYFDNKLNLMMGLSQTFIIISSMICPLIIAYVVEAFGFRRALIVLALYSLLNIPATAALQPVERHMKKIPVNVRQEDDDTDPRRELSKAVLQTQQMNLLGDNKEQKLLGKIDDQTEYFDLSLLKDPEYLNMVIGISLAFNADVNFIAVLRMILHNLNFEVSAISLAMTVHFCSDLVSRIIFSIISAMMSFRSRNVFLVGACLSAVFRIVFTLRDDFLWKTVSLGVLGFLRCFIQTTFPLVISEKYKDNFSTAFSLYMVVCGVVSMLFGPLLSYVKAFTQDDVMIIHVLTASYCICSFTWTIESLATKFYKRNDTTNIDL